MNKIFKKKLNPENENAFYHVDIENNEIIFVFVFSVAHGLVRYLLTFRGFMIASVAL